MRADKRVLAILSEINCCVLADIGADHGIISHLALKENRASLVYAVDISDKCLDKVRKLVNDKGLNGKLIPVLGDGFSTLNKTPDEAVIAGLGGNEIVKIITEAGARLPRKLIIVPHQDADVLREFISGKFRVCKDYIVEAGGKYYPIIVISDDGSTVYDSSSFRFGLNYPQTLDYDKMLVQRYADLKVSFALSSGRAPALALEMEEIENIWQKLKT